MKKRKKTLWISILLYALCFVIFAGSIIYINKEAIAIKVASDRLEKNLKKAYGIDPVELKLEKMSDSPSRDLHFRIKGLDFDDGKVYYRYRFKVSENGLSYLGLTDSKGVNYCDSYVNRVYGEETQAFLEDLIETSGVLDGRDYVLVFDPWMVCTNPGPYLDFEDYKANYDAGVAYIRPLFYMGIVGAVSQEKFDEIVEVFSNASSPFNVRIGSVPQTTMEQIKKLKSTYGEACELTHDSCLADLWSQVGTYTRSSWGK